MEEDEKKEAALANVAVLQPNFKSRRLTEDQISKFKELHRKRLQTKAKLKIHENFKGNALGAGKRHGKELGNAVTKHKDSTFVPEESINGDSGELLSVQLDRFTASLSTKKSQKLHWGLDTKERWERKANM